jgi:hypothetical protein
VVTQRARIEAAWVALVVVLGLGCATIAGLDSTYGPIEDDGGADAMGEGDATDGASRSDAEDGRDAGDAAADARADAGDADASEVGSPGSTPGKVACGNASCDLSLPETCCSGLPAPNSIRCEPGMSCVAGATIACDEAADCPDIQMCCVDALGQDFASTHCAFDCVGARGQACRTDQECATGSCTEWTCGAMHIFACGPQLISC